MDEKSEKKHVSAPIAALNFIIEWAGMIALVIMTVIVNFSVVTRYVFSYTPSWSESGSLLCMVWFGFLSMALGVRDNQHISITILDQILGEKGIKKLDLFKNIAIFLFGIFMIKDGLVLCEIGQYNNLPGLGLSSTFQYAAVPCCGFAMCVYALRQFILDFKEKGVSSDGD